MQDMTHQCNPNLPTSTPHPTETGQRVQSASTSTPPYLQADADIRVKLKSLAKCILVSIGVHLIGWPPVRALFTWALSVCGLKNV